MEAPELGALENAVAAGMPQAIALLRQLVAARSVLGAEEPAQEIVERRLTELGFIVRSVTPEADHLAGIPGSGMPLISYEGRRCLVASLDGTTNVTLALNGHVDVVSEEPLGQWTSPPFEPTVEQGRMYGRGASDMKGGIVAMLLALEAATSIGPLPSKIVYHSVIEEECTGNGALTALLESPRLDGAVIGEPTGGAIALAGVGVIWARITLSAPAGHAQSADERGNVIEDMYKVIACLRELEQELNTDVDEEFRDTGKPYLVNIGALHSGNWPATTPGIAELDVRVGFPICMDPVDAQERLREAVGRSGFCAAIEFRGFRANGFSFPTTSPVAALLASCHRAVHGTPPLLEAFRATCDLRYFQPPLGPGSAACYGPTGGGWHGPDEWVDLESIQNVATVLALFLRRFGRA